MSRLLGLLHSIVHPPPFIVPSSATISSHCNCRHISLQSASHIVVSFVRNWPEFLRWFIGSNIRSYSNTAPEAYVWHRLQTVQEAGQHEGSNRSRGSRGAAAAAAAGGSSSRGSSSSSSSSSDMDGNPEHVLSATLLFLRQPPLLLISSLFDSANIATRAGLKFA